MLRLALCAAILAQVLLAGRVLADKVADQVRALKADVGTAEDAFRNGSQTRTDAIQPDPELAPLFEPLLQRFRATQDFALIEAVATAQSHRNSDVGFKALERVLMHVRYSDPYYCEAMKLMAEDYA